MTSQLSMFVSQGKWMPFHRHFVHFSPSTHFFSLHTPKKIHASVATQKGTTCLPSSHSINFPAFFSLKKKKKLNCQKRSEFKRRVGSFEPPFSIFSNKSFSSLGTKRNLFFCRSHFEVHPEKCCFFQSERPWPTPWNVSFIIWSVKQPPGQIQCQG